MNPRSKAVMANTLLLFFGLIGFLAFKEDNLNLAIFSVAGLSVLMTALALSWNSELNQALQDCLESLLFVFFLVGFLGVAFAIFFVPVDQKYGSSSWGAAYWHWITLGLLAPPCLVVIGRLIFKKARYKDV